MAFLFVEVLRPAAALCGALLVLSFGGEAFKRWSLAKARERVRTKGSTITVTMDDQGIETSSAFGTAQLNWKIMLEPVIYSDGVLIKLSRVNMIWLPDTALAEGSPADVRQLLAVNVKG
ncbi:MAG: YcxB family protein [Steroidobacteraceae bacterium]